MRQYAGDLGRDLAGLLTHLQPAIPKRDDAGGGGVVAVYVVPSQVTRVSSPAVKLDRHPVLGVEDVAVLAAAATAGSGLPGSSRQGMRLLDITEITVLQTRVDSIRRGAECLAQLMAPAQPTALR